MSLSTIQSADIEGQPPRILEFLEWLSLRSPSEFMSLFSDTRQAAEKEAMIYQTIKAMVYSYHESGQLFSKVALARDSSLAQNSTAFNWLVANGYLVIEGDRCAVTELAMAKLYIHFVKELKAHPTAIKAGF